MSSVFRGLRSPAMFWLEEEMKGSGSKGIGSILGTERPSLRRTFSADMSSKKWLAGLKKVASSQEISTMASSPRDSSSSSSSSEDEEEVRRKDMERPGQFDIWSSILSQKEMDSKTQPLTPYIHPLVKRSLSSLSEKSLEICTENLGSETGSDGFSSDLDYSASEIDEEEKEEERVQKDVIVGDGTSFQGNNNRNQNQNQNQPRTPTHERSFPPPLPSLLREGPCFHMKSHRKNGRLVLEAVPLPSHNLFQAQREKGRLVLTFINTPTKETKVVTQVEETKVEETHAEETQEENEEIDVEEEVRVDRGIMMEVKVRQKEMVMSMLMSGSGLTMANRNRTSNRNPYLNLWAGEKMDREKDTVEPRRMDSTVSRLILPTVNVYECYRRNTASPAIFISPATPNNNNVRFSKKLPLLLKNVNDLGQLARVRRCTEPHSTSVIWEPYCIPTS
ncbi:FAF-like protein (DUF3049) isoform X2 [Tasmannia lanceolata]